MSVLEVFGHSDIVGQVITIGLAVCSVVAWGVIWGKHKDLNQLRSLNRAFELYLRDQRTIIDAPEGMLTKRHIPFGDMFADAIDAYRRAAAFAGDESLEAARFRLEHAENALQRSLARQVLRYESNMIFLASIVSGAPFLGLLGTVWGVMEAFSAVSVQQTASIQTLAPGVSGALLTTIAGLVVAIPSVFGYNFLMAKTKVMITEIENYASSLADRVELESR